ncbi:MAG: PLP-dependent transferase [Gammaproteobacteria bacterium]|nr:PLP-dependent transferase [Gammaproteobacteria bacterium]
MKENSKKHLDTRVIHGGQQVDPSTGAVMPPIYTTSTYAQKSPGDHQGYEYSRTHNPTRQAYERCVAELEGGDQGFAFASGMAAISTILELLPSGSHIIANDDLYGGTFRLFTRVREQSAGLEFSFVDIQDRDVLDAVIRPETKMLWVETPTNPMLKVIDLEMTGAWAKEKNVISVCDNTFASPCLQQPLQFGFDIVVHSATKYLSGHSDVVSGVAVTADMQLSEQMAFLSNSIGAIAGPFDSFLALRGIKTLALRMQRHCQNAHQLAEWLGSQKQVQQVIYPGLPEHPQHELAQQQMSAFGGIVSVVLDTDLDGTRRFLENLEVFTLAESLGGVESLANHPGIMTHASVPPEIRDRLGIHDNLVRLSVGIEHVDDLQNDLQQALIAV